VSWDISVGVDTGGEFPASVAEVRNLTWNNGNILAALKCHPSDMKGKPCSEVAPIARQALADSWMKEAELKKLEPGNGWGGVDDVRDYLEKLVKVCEEHPKAMPVVR